MLVDTLNIPECHVFNNFNIKARTSNMSEHYPQCFLQKTGTTFSQSLNRYITHTVRLTSTINTTLLANFSQCVVRYEIMYDLFHRIASTQLVCKHKYL
jgi:hypothetical protein